VVPVEEACRQEELGFEWDTEKVDIRQTDLETETARIASLVFRVSRRESIGEEEEEVVMSKRGRLLSRASDDFDKIREVAETVYCAWKSRDLADSATLTVLYDSGGAVLRRTGRSWMLLSNVGNVDS